mgnify:CR=1 FL=1
MTNITTILGDKVKSVEDDEQKEKQDSGHFAESMRQAFLGGIGSRMIDEYHNPVEADREISEETESEEHPESLSSEIGIDLPTGERTMLDDVVEEQPQELPEETADEQLQESPKETMSELAEEQPKELPRDVSNEAQDVVPVELPDEAPQELLSEQPSELESPKALPSELPEGLPEESPSDLPKELPQELPEESPKELLKELPEELPEELPKELPSELPSELPDKLPEESPKEIPKELPEELPRELPSELPSELPQELPEELPGELPGELPQELPSELPQELPQELPSELPDELPQELPDELPQELPQEVPQELPSELPQELPEELPSEQPQELPDELPSELPEELPHELPSELPQELPEELPQELPSDTPSELPQELPQEAPSERPSEVPQESPKETKPVEEKELNNPFDKSDLPVVDLKVGDKIFDRTITKVPNLNITYRKILSMSEDERFKRAQDGMEESYGASDGQVWLGASDDVVKSFNQGEMLDIALVNKYFVNYVNADRKAHKIKPLVYEPKFQSSADERAQEMADYGHIRYEGRAHTRPDGTKWVTVLKDKVKNYPYGLGENLQAYSVLSNPYQITSEQYVAKTLFERWKNSPSHYENMMDSRLTRTAVSVKMTTRAGARSENETNWIIGEQILADGELND